MDECYIADTKDSNGVVSVTAPVSSNSGVSPDSVNKTSSQEYKWFLMRVSYGREQKVYDYLTTKGFRAFLPCQTKVYEHDGRKKRKKVSLIPNVLFVYSSEIILKDYVGKRPYPYFHHYYKTIRRNGNESKRNALTVPECQMDEFIKWCNVECENKRFSQQQYMFNANDMVQVMDGPFKGFKGKIARYKGNTCVGVNIEGVGFICTSYIPKSFLKRI